MVAITSLAAMSIWSVVISSLCVSCWSVSNVSCGDIAELVEVYEGFGYREDEWGVVSGGGVCVRRGRARCGVSYLGEFC